MSFSENGRKGWETAGIQLRDTTKGFYGVTFTLEELEDTARVLTNQKSKKKFSDKDKNKTGRK